MTGLPIALVVAAADNDVIGRNNALPWDLPADLAHFRRVTMGKPILMGRKTFESIGRPLPGRSNIVISRDPDFSADGVRVVDSVDAALELAEHIALIDGSDELMVIGGAQIYALTLPRAQRLYVTRAMRICPPSTGPGGAKSRARIMTRKGGVRVLRFLSTRGLMSDRGSIQGNVVTLRS